jgi:hypothetical protein
LAVHDRRNTQTNGMVERFNGRVSSEVLGITVYSHRQLEQLLRGFNAAYNARRQRVLGGKTPDQIVTERLEAEPTLARAAPNGRAGPCDTTKARLIAERAKEVSQPDTCGDSRPCCTTSTRSSPRPRSCSAGGDDPPDASNGQATWVRQVVDEARAEGYELVVIDTAALADQSALKAAQVSDLVLIPVRPTVMDVDAIATSQDICALARKPSLFVLNAVPPQGTESDETQALIEGRGGEVAQVRIGARKPYAQAFNSGRGVQEMLPASVATREIKVLYDLLHDVMVQRSHTLSRVTVGAHN